MKSNKDPDNESVEILIENIETTRQQCRDMLEKLGALERQKELKEHRLEQEKKAKYYKSVLKPGETKEQFKEKKRKSIKKMIINQQKEREKLFARLGLKHERKKTIEESVNTFFHKTPEDKKEDADHKAHLNNLEKEEEEYQKRQRHPIHTKFKKDLDDIKSSVQGDLSKNRTKYKP